MFTAIKNSFILKTPTHSDKDIKMTSFVTAVDNQMTRTTNGMLTRASSANASVDLFFAVGASRGKDIVPKFVAAYVENADLALRIIQWARDVRGGAGERELFRQVLRYLENTNPQDAARLLVKIPEIGRYDDLLIFKTKPLKDKAYSLLGDALRAGQTASDMLARIDAMTEAECAEALSRL